MGVVADQNQLARTGFDEVACAGKSATESQGSAFGHFNGAQQRVECGNRQCITGGILDLRAIEVNVPQCDASAHIGSHSTHAVNQQTCG